MWRVRGAVLFIICVLLGSQPSVATELTSRQLALVDLVARLIVAGSDGRCPGMRVLDGAVAEDLLLSGLAFDAQLGLEALIEQAGIDAAAHHRANPEAFCEAALRLGGPGGKHGHQLLVASERR